MPEDVDVEIFGQIFRIAAVETSPGYVQRLACYVDEKMRAVASTARTMPLNRMAILTALNIADDLFKLREAHEQSLHLVDTKAAHLIALVRAQLHEDER